MIRIGREEIQPSIAIEIAETAGGVASHAAIGQQACRSGCEAAILRENIINGGGIVGLEAVGATVEAGQRVGGLARILGRCRQGLAGAEAGQCQLRWTRA